jgi:predicted ATPase/DNA-binding CsgD family transcriptional regulator
MRDQRTGNLPTELTSFVGRQAELTNARRLLSDSRLVTLVGVGGVGKTRLALRVAARMRRTFRDGVWLVELDQLHDEALVAATVMRALGLPETSGSPVLQLREFLADRQVLLVLDNCEHLIHPVAKLADTLLREVPELRILTTSREPLEVGGEVTLRVAPLATPALEHPVTLAELAGYDSVALFTDRASSVVAGFGLGEANRAAVAGICRRLDGLPLAIELAAARLRVLAPEQILQRLSDQLGLLIRSARAAPTRQQTLRACIAWSYELCTGAEQELWARLSVFAADIDLKAVEDVCTDGRLGCEDLVELISSLVDKSILTRLEDRGGAARYRMLDSIRAYGRQRLAETGQETTIRRGHRDRYQRLAHQARDDWVSQHQVKWLRWLPDALPELRAALQFSLSEPGEADIALQIITELQMYWIVRGLHREAQHWLQTALAHPGEPGPTRVLALFLHTTLAAAQGDVVTATTGMRQLREAAAQVDHALSHAVVAVAEGALATAQGDLATTVTLYEGAIADFRAEADIYWQVVMLPPLTLTKMLRGDTAGATVSYQELVALCRPHGELWACGFCAMALGIGLWQQGDLEGAAERMGQAARLLRQTDDTMATSWCLEVFAWIAAGRDQHDKAAALLGAAEQLAKEMGNRAAAWPDLLTYHDQIERQTRQTLGESAFRAALSHGQRLPLDHAIALALGQEIPKAQSPPEDLTGNRAIGPLSDLTRREREVAALIAQGLSNKQIADRLVISRRTAEGHVENIMTKLGCTSRGQVAARLRSAN